MALNDTETFVRQVVAAFDSSIDVSAGSTFDTQVIQPLVRRLGADPYTIDLPTFLVERLRQAYPLLATGEGDNLVDILVKPLSVLWDPVIREGMRLRRSSSFADPTTLTTAEADSLGGNFFEPRRKGAYAKGTARVLFASPQQVTLTQNNFFTTRQGLVFYPSTTQSIRSAEMLLNIDSDGNYYFDVQATASSPGEAYNVYPGEIKQVANLPAAIKVTNVGRFREGLDEETPVQYAERLQQGLGEKSLVALRGIAAKLLDAFPSLSRLNVVGFNDPEMSRDVLTGGGLGGILAYGSRGVAIEDGSSGSYTARFFTDEVDLQALIGSSTQYVLSVLSGTSTKAPIDVAVTGVPDAHSVQLAQQVLLPGATGLVWTLRKSELTLSGIPGGILFPNTANGALTLPSGSVHVGGAYDTYVRETGFDDATLVVSSVVDDKPLLSGTQLVVTDITGSDAKGTSLVVLRDAVVLTGAPGAEAVARVLGAAEYEGYALQIQNGPNAGAYRVLEYLGGDAQGHAQLRVSGTLAVASSVAVRWRLFDDIDVDLVEPKETRISGTDLVLTQGLDVATTASGVDFESFGVSKGDVLRVYGGQGSVDYDIVEDPLVPTYGSIRLDRVVATSEASVSYAIFRPEAGGLQLPLVRVRTVELLDSSSQPQGSYVPYAKPVDVQSRAFQNPAKGVKHDLRDVRLGIVSALSSPVGTWELTSSSNSLRVYAPGVSSAVIVVTLPVGMVSVEDVVEGVNQAVYAASGGQVANVAMQLTPRRFGMRPVADGLVAVVGGTAMPVLFGGADVRTTQDLRTDASDAQDSWWASRTPAIDMLSGLDVATVLDGKNVGHYAGPYTLALNASAWGIAGAPPSRALVVPGVHFSPDAQRHVVFGARSLGSARVFFLEPTTFEVGPDTVFSLDTGSTGVAKFVPDPTLAHQQVPPLPSGETPYDGAISAGQRTLESASQDFLLSNINLGDVLYVERQPLAGTMVHSGSSVAVAGKTFVYSVDNSPDRTLVFVRDDPTVPSTEVTKAGVVEQLNASVGMAVASYDTEGHLVLKTAHSVTIRSSGSANPVLLGMVLGYGAPRAYAESDVSNESPVARDGGYTITHVGQQSIQVEPAFTLADPLWPAALTEQSFRVERRGIQRTCTTQMAAQVAEDGLYYADVELVSEGTGDFWNIAADQQMSVEGYKSEGYYLTTDDSNLTFSTRERPRLILSRSILEQGMDDDPRNATQLTGQSLQIAYDRSSLVSDVQDFVMSDLERTVCSSPLSRHLIPHFVRVALTFYGGSDASAVQQELEKYIKGTYPTDGLTASAIQKIALAKGATKVENPITLLAIVHAPDRSVWVQRSLDALSTGRLSAFFPDKLTVTRSVKNALLG